METHRQSSMLDDYIFLLSSLLSSFCRWSKNFRTLWWTEWFQNLELTHPPRRKASKLWYSATFNDGYTVQTSLVVPTHMHGQPILCDTPQSNVEQLFSSKLQLHSASVSAIIAILGQCKFSSTMFSWLFFLMSALPPYPNRQIALSVCPKLLQY